VWKDRRNQQLSAYEADVARAVSAQERGVGMLPLPNFPHTYRDDEGHIFCPSETPKYIGHEG
jgi:hypothetical protein